MLSSRSASFLVGQFAIIVIRNSQYRWRRCARWTSLATRAGEIMEIVVSLPARVRQSPFMHVYVRVPWCALDMQPAYTHTRVPGGVSGSLVLSAAKEGVFAIGRQPSVCREFANETHHLSMWIQPVHSPSEDKSVADFQTMLLNSCEFLCEVLARPRVIATSDESCSSERRRRTQQSWNSDSRRREICDR